MAIVVNPELRELSLEIVRCQEENMIEEFAPALDPTTCNVMYCGANWATGAPMAYHYLQRVTVQRPNFEPSGSEFEPIRVCH